MLPRFRSKSIRKIGKEAKFRYVRKGGRAACCSLCHAELGGKTKSSRRPSRIFGGTLCPECSVQVIKLAGKVMGGHIKLEDVDLERMKFVKCLVKQ
jgi:ribosomal protein L34E